MNRKSWSVIAALGAAATLSCGASGGRPVPLEDLAAETSAAECDFLVRCHLMSDVGICRAFYDHINALLTFDSFASTIASARAGKASYDDAAARECLDQIRNADCGQTSPNPAALCARAFTGKVADGDSCIADAACGARSSCEMVASTGTPVCNGACMPLGPSAACRNDTHCPSGQICDLVMNGTECVVPVPAGARDQPCGSHRTCQSGLFCEVAVATSGGIEFSCKARGRSGDPCSGVPGACEDGLICVPSDDRSTVTCMAPAARGEPCQAFGQCGGPLLSSIGCDPATHVCIDLPSSGPCLAGGIEGCNPVDSYCDFTQTPPVCLPVVAHGAACTAGTLACGLFSDDECTSTTTASTCAISPVTQCAP